MKFANQKLLAVFVAACAAFSVSTLAEVILPTPAEQVALNPRISQTIVGNYATSFLLTTLADVPSGYSIQNGSYVAWCVDSFVGIEAGTAYQPVFYDSYDDLTAIGAVSPNWGIVNYIINKRADYVSDLGATSAEIQDAIWSFIGGGGIGQTLLESGQIEGSPMPDLAIVQQIMADAIPHANFVPAPGQLRAIVLDLGETAQRTIIEVRCPDSHAGPDTFQAVLVQNGGVPAVRFTALTDKTYTVQWKAVLTDATWLKLADVPAQPSDTLLEVSDPGAVGQNRRFYRVVTPAEP